MANNSHPKLNSSSLAQKTTRSTKINFAYAFRPIYYFSRIFGLFPFTIIYDWNGDIQEARVKLLDIVWFLISFVTYFAMAFYCYMTVDFPKNYDALRFLILGDYVLLIAGLLFGVVLVLIDMFNRHILVDIMKKLTKFDRELMKVGFYVPYKNLRHRTLYWYTATSVITVVLSISTILSYSKFREMYSTLRIVSYFLCYIVQHFAGATIVTSYIILIFGISKRFDILNSILKDKFLSMNSLLIGYNKRESISFIKFTGRQHELLTGISEKVNHCYAIQVYNSIN